MKIKTVDAARGRWAGILAHFGVDQSFLRNVHGPCPTCGGTDRFRFDDKDGTRIEVEIPPYSDLTAVTQAFSAFLKACGYSTDNLADYFE